MESALRPDQILEKASATYEKKARQNIKKTLVLSFIAGIFIALGAVASTLASFNLLSDPNKIGLGKLIQGLTFTPGLIFVLIAGGELFTGNNLMAIAFLDKKISVGDLLKSWLIVYFGNFIGSIFVAFLIYKSGQWQIADNDLAARVILIANQKINLSFSQGMILGIFCNFLVCLGVWMALGAKDYVGKVLSAIFPVVAFVVSGFEHSVANMYYIPAGIFAKNIPAFVEKTGLSLDELSHLNFLNMFTKNLIPVTLGNIIGGAILVGLLYFIAFKEKEN